MINTEEATITQHGNAEHKITMVIVATVDSRGSKVNLCPHLKDLELHHGGPEETKVDVSVALNLVISLKNTLKWTYFQANCRMHRKHYLSTKGVTSCVWLIRQEEDDEDKLWQVCVTLWILAVSSK